MKAQAALEYLMVASLVIGIMVTVFAFTVFYSSDSISSIQGQNAVNNIAKMADTAYSLGKGSFLKTTVTFPEGILNSSVNGKIISITIRTSSGVSNLIAQTSATVNGSLPNTDGTFAISANMTDPNVTIRVVQ